MDGITGHLIKFAARLVVFSAVVFVASRKNPKVKIERAWATPLIGLSLAVLDTGFYWALKPILNLATLGAFGLIMPLVINGVFLLVTLRVFASKRWFVVDGLMPTLWLTVALTVGHGALWLGLDYLPGQLHSACAAPATCK
jgi:hypothetical protein